ncbi:MAG: flagellar hook-associated protein FlgK [Ignavibacteriaceae bacterium]|nr:flagellar hook-associated protein FlgK [Ignavibacteriaceae bacterium]
MLTKIFDISSRSLAVYRRALEVTSHNIANASNPFYSRQRILFETDSSDRGAGTVWGNGVKIGDVQRVRDSLIDAHLINTNPNYSNSNRQSQLIGDIEKIFSEPSDLGISNLITSLFSSFNELSVTPNSAPLRTNVLNAANNLAAKVNSVNESIDVLKGDIMNEFQHKVTEVNTLLKEIHQLNIEQFNNSNSGLSVNDILDKRDQLISDLSKLVNINVSVDNTNSVSISIGGALAVDRMHSTEFTMVEKNGNLQLQVKDGAYPVILTGGELSGLSEVYSQKIPKYKEKLDEVVNTLMNSINSEHMKGYSITNPQETGIKFFESYENGILTVNPEIINDVNKIAISADGTEGNGEIALRISQLTDAKLINGSTISESYSVLINTLGNDGLLQSNYAEANLLVINQLEDQQASQSGVSIDEEMTNVLKFQRTYEASAKLITVADEILKTILEMV